MFLVKKSLIFNLKNIYNQSVAVYPLPRLQLNKLQADSSGWIGRRGLGGRRGFIQPTCGLAHTWFTSRKCQTKGIQHHPIEGEAGGGLPDAAPGAGDGQCADRVAHREEGDDPLVDLRGERLQARLGLRRGIRRGDEASIPPFEWKRYEQATYGELKGMGSFRARLVQLHKQLHEQLHNFNSQTANSLTNSLVSFSDNSLSQS
jgi:hypothetical protein